jgi:predicted DNA-binding transcriptional regulator AlpA
MKPTTQVSALVRREVLRQFAELVARLLTIQDIAEALRCHERTFRRRRKKWKFPAPAISEGNFIRWTPLQLQQWQTNHKKTSLKSPQNEICLR